QDSLVELFVKHQIPLCVGIIPFEATHRAQSLLSRSESSQKTQPLRSESPAWDSEQPHNLKHQIQIGTIELMMHGFAHTDNASSPAQSPPTPAQSIPQGTLSNTKSKSKYGKSEFAGDSYEWQYERLKSGKSYLDSLFEKEVEIFSPPWNTY